MGGGRVGGLGSEVTLEADGLRITDYDALVARRGHARRAELVPLARAVGAHLSRIAELAAQLPPGRPASRGLAAAAAACWALRGCHGPVDAARGGGECEGVVDRL
ncbi:unnamed protein product [Prorocentrum cordatum]|uniref:Uncharacterized protein n=1 Tax=Prorocentrum cordatum TaxID=2364126 RepID=A0ABN9Q9N5_9DINO|nr:unnamed protein product [Polarella glacialis]